MHTSKAHSAHVGTFLSLKALCLSFFLLLVSPSWGSTWYISTTGSDSNSGTSSGAAFATFAHALAAMSGCDTLIVENGYYYDSANINTSNLNGNVGSTGCYTVIEAATPWGVTVDASTVTPEPNGAFSLSNVSYVQIIGIKGAGSPTWTGADGNQGTAWFVQYSNHIKLQQTAGYNTPCSILTTDNYNIDVYSIGPADSYVLVEDSHAWGCGRYKFMAYQSDHVIFRRDVARHDFHACGNECDTSPEPSVQAADFTNYDSQYSLFQNDIAIDSGDLAQDTGHVYGGLWSEHNDGGIDTPLEFEGSIVDNVYGTASWQDDKDSGTHTFVNDASVNSEGGAMIGALVSTLTGSNNSVINSNLAVVSVTFGASNTTINTITTGNPVGVTYFNNQLVSFTGLTGPAAVLNGLWFNMTATGLPNQTQFEIPYVTTPGGPYTTGGSAITFQGVTFPTTNVSHITIANASGTNLGNYDVDANSAIGVGVSGGSPLTYYTSQTVANNIFQNITSGDGNTAAISDWVTPNYNYYYENTDNFQSTVYLGYTPTAGPNDVQGTNPQLKYITREEVGSPVYGTASDGGNIGATILYEIGTTGTLYGDTGYDTITGTSLWPFPNEGVIKSDMASFSMTNPVTGNPINGARGFAASGTGLYGGLITLTSYIWEALGNACPSTICPSGTITATPSFNPMAATYTSAQTVTISDATGGSTIYYTTNGTTPTTLSPVYSTPIIISSTTTLEAIATASGYTTSAVASGVFTINLPAATPSFNPGATTYTSAQTVTISDVTGGSTIYYTTNGTTPTTLSPVYSAPITISSTTTLEAIATASGYSASAVESGAYTISSSGGSSPQYVTQCSNWGNYVETVSCTISGVGAGNALVIGVYTAASTTPTITASAGTPVTVITDLPEASASNYLDAAYLANTSSGNITITATTSVYTNIWISVSEYSNTSATPLDNYTSSTTNPGYGATSMSTEDFITAASDDMMWTMCAGLSLDAAFYAGTVPITWTAVNSYKGTDTAPWLFVEDGLAGVAGPSNYGQCLSNTSIYAGGAGDASIMTLAIKGASTPVAATPTFSPTPGPYGPAQTVTISDSTLGSTIYYTTNGTTPTTLSSTYSTAFTVSATEILQAIATASGYSQSAVGSAAYTINGPAATPTFSLTTGTYSSAQTVTISDGTTGATIYYTTNGTTPTTASSTYSTAITVSATETLKAIAAKAAYSNSAVESATYTIAAPSNANNQCNHYTAGGATATVYCTLPNSVTAGDALVIGVWSTASTITSVTASSGTPSNIITPYAGPGSNGYVSAWLLSNAASGTITITVTAPAYSNNFLTVVDYTGVSTAPLDGYNTGFVGSGTYGQQPVSSNTFTTTSANDMLWSMCSTFSGEGLTVGGAPIAWTSLGSYTTGQDIFWEDEVAGTPSTYYGQCEKSGNGYDVDILAVALK